MKSDLRTGDLYTIGIEGEVVTFIRESPYIVGTSIVRDENDDSVIVPSVLLHKYDPLESIDGWKNGEEVVVDSEIFIYVGPDPRNKEHKAHILIGKDNSIISIAGSIISTIIKVRK